MESQRGALVMTCEGHWRFGKSICGNGLYLTEGSFSMVIGVSRSGIRLLLSPLDSGIVTWVPLGAERAAGATRHLTPKGG
ncbi:hypothetical protein GCM10011349_11730 [Novosphingobium indicum]|uniref:Uncharacterized protein n=1 Tax=Novosphingobium indicum TaxID=462949 RepID=A0ABQ2JHU0_9SPHN|nr:hypothetical protein GCM10011349_11730 [Novosphingobium indicum]